MAGGSNTPIAVRLNRARVKLLTGGSGGFNVMDLDGTAAKFNRMLMCKRTATTKTTAGAVTLTIAELITGLILRDPNGAARSDVFPTIALIIAGIPNYVAGMSFKFTIRNTADGAGEVITMTGGTGGTLSGVMTIPVGGSRTFLLRIDSATAYSVYDLTGAGSLDFTGAATGISVINLTDNLADALSVKEGSTAYLKFVTTNSAEAVNVGVDLSITDAKNVILDTTTGTKIGTAVTQKLGFWNKTPVVQPAAALQGALTNSTGGSQDGTLAAVGNTMAGDVSATINSNFTDIYALVDAMRTALVNTGIMKGAA